MGFTLARYGYNGTVHWGVVVEDQIRPLQTRFETLHELLQDGKREVREAASNASNVVPLQQVKLLSPVTKPTQVVCQGANYSSHRAEAGMKPERPPFNLIFTKSDASLSGPNDDIVRPSNVKLLDYEIEVALVIGKAISGSTRIDENNFGEYVAGIVITNDVSARDVQFTQGQWYKAKSYRTFCPTGPYLYLFDEGEARQIHNLELKLWVNGELRQSAVTQQLLFKPEETLTELSTFIDFAAGDLLLTGTPGGVALSMKSETLDQLSNPFLPGNTKLDLILGSQAGNAKYLKDGDVIKCEVKSLDGKIHLGTQENRIIPE